VCTRVSFVHEPSVDTCTLNMCVYMSYTGFTRRFLVIAPAEYVNIYSTPKLLSWWWVGGGVSGDGDDYMLTPAGYPPPPNTAADMAPSRHSTQPALRPHRATPRAEDRTTQTRRPHLNGLCSPLSEGPDPRSAQMHVNVFVGGQVGKSKQRYPHPNRFPRSKFDTR